MANLCSGTVSLGGFRRARDTDEAISCFSVDGKMYESQCSEILSGSPSVQDLTCLMVLPGVCCGVLMVLSGVNGVVRVMLLGVNGVEWCSWCCEVCVVWC